MRDFSDPQAEALLKQVALSRGFSNWLQIDLVAAGNGQSELILPFKKEVTQHHGFVHGGVIGTVADIACAYAAATVAGDVMTASYSLQFLAPAKGERLRVHAQTLKAGKRQISVEAKVWAEADDTEPKLCAVMLASIAPVGK